MLLPFQAAWRWGEGWDLEFKRWRHPSSQCSEVLPECLSCCGEGWDTHGSSWMSFIPFWIVPRPVGFLLWDVMATNLVAGLSRALFCLSSVLTTVSSQTGGFFMPHAYHLNVYRLKLVGSCHGNKEVAYVSSSHFNDPLAEMQAPGLQVPGHLLGNCSPHSKKGKKT